MNPNRQGWRQADSSNDSIAGTLGRPPKPWYGAGVGPQHVVLYGAQKVAKTKRDVDGG